MTVPIVGLAIKPELQRTTMPGMPRTIGTAPGHAPILAQTFAVTGPVRGRGLSGARPSRWFAAPSCWLLMRNSK
jgi:hypothetical protein